MKRNDKLIRDICKYCEVDVNEFPGDTRRREHLLLKLYYFSVEYYERVNESDRKETNATEVMLVLERERSLYKYYVQLLTTDIYMMQKVQAFLNKYGYKSMFFNL